MTIETSRYTEATIPPGVRFGEWTVIGIAAYEFPTAKPKRYRYRCRCSCGRERIFFAEKLLYSTVTNCGILDYRHETSLRASSAAVSPATPTLITEWKPLRQIWEGIQDACLNRSHTGDVSIGVRGIALAPTWHTFAAFQQWAREQGYRTGLFLRRIDPNGVFAPDNCEWTEIPLARRGQPRIMLTLCNETKSLSEWSDDARCQVSYQTLLHRVKSGWTAEEALARDRRIIRTDRMISAFGEEKSICAWMNDPRCQLYSVKTFTCRLESGWDIERALTTPPIEGRPVHQITAFNETKSLKGWSHDSRCVVERGVLRNRLLSGWDAESALTTLPGHRLRARYVTAFGETKPLAAWANDSRNMVSKKVFITRVYKGWVMERALTEPESDATGDTENKPQKASADQDGSSGTRP